MRQTIVLGVLVLVPLTGCDLDGIELFPVGDSSTTTAGTTAAGGSGGTTDVSINDRREGSSAGAPGEPIACPHDLQAIPDRIAEAICAKRMQCCIDDIDTCMTEVRGALEEIYPNLPANDETETVSSNCDAFDACALALHEAKCDAWPFQQSWLGGLPVDEPACLEIFTPKVRDGEACSYNYECIDGICRVDEGDTVGTCDGYAPVGGACDDMCDLVTMFCDSSNTCQLRLPDGDDCTESDQCESRECDGEVGKCITPEPHRCRYVPDGAAHCAIGGAARGGRAPAGSATLLALAGLGLCLARRRTR